MLKSSSQHQHTLNHKKCPACKRDRERATQLLRLSAMDLKEAGELIISGKVDRRLKPATLESNHGYLDRLIEFFGAVQIKKIHAGSFLAYQEYRRKTAGTSAINHELNFLSQIMKRAGLWEPIKYHYAPLKEEPWQKPKTFTGDEEQRIFEFAKDDPNLELAEIVFTITRYTSASGCELRLMRIGATHDIFDGDRPRVEITADTTKNLIRPRTIPLIPESREAFRRAILRANKLGSHLEWHYLFPLRVNRAFYNPMKPASKSWLRKQTVKLREGTGIQHLRPHAWRHQIVTEMLEKGVPRDTVVGVCGWISEKMIETYCHTRYEAKADALLSTVSAKKPSQSAETHGKLVMFPGAKNN